MLVEYTLNMAVFFITEIKIIKNIKNNKKL